LTDGGLGEANNLKIRDLELFEDDLGRRRWSRCERKATVSSIDAKRMLAICPFRAYRNLERGQAMTRGVSKKSVSIKPAYAPVNQADGLRILVDRLWPRGLQKADAHIDHWLHNLAPITPLRK
jgi:hypothetical protein